MKRQLSQRTLTIGGSLTVRLVCLFNMDSAALFMSNEPQFYLVGRIQTSQTGGQPYSDTSPYGECSPTVAQPPHAHAVHFSVIRFSNVVN